VTELGKDCPNQPIHHTAAPRKKKDVFVNTRQKEAKKLKGLRQLTGQEP